MSSEYNLESTFILKAFDENNNFKKGTCFAISDSLVVSAKHIVVDKTTFQCFLNTDDYVNSNGINLDIFYEDKDLDFVILKTNDNKFKSYIPIGKIQIQRKESIKICGYPQERADNLYAPIDTFVDTDFSSTSTSDFCFSVEQCPTVTDYKGMSGSPIMYQGYVVGMLIVQQGDSILYALSSSKIFEYLSTVEAINIYDKKEIDYVVPEHPSSPFRNQINCSKSLPNIKGLDIGFDYKVWRLNSLVEFAMEWIIDYSLSSAQKESLSNRSTSLYRKAFKNYPIDNINAMSDLFLHIAIRENYKTIPIINKIFDIDGNSIFSTSHVVMNSGDIEIWLGVSSIKNNIHDAVADALQSIASLITLENLNERLVLITQEMDTTWPFTDKLARISDGSIPMSERFDKIIIPIFITYDSDTIKSYEESEFLNNLQTEIDLSRDLIRSDFSNNIVDLIDLRVFIFPVNDIEQVHEKFIQELR